MNNKVRIGFIGTGFMGQMAHLSNYIGLKDCEVVAIAEPRKNMAQKVAKHYGIKEIYSNHTELLNNCDVDAIVAAQPFDHHVNLLPDILKAKKALLTEKPIAVSAESGAYLAQLAKENNVPYMVGYHKRSDPATEYAVKLIREWKKSGDFGKMRQVRITMPPGDWTQGISWNDMISSDEPYPSIVRETIPSYFTQEIGNEYVSFVNYYIHQVNAMRFMFGEPYKVTYAEKSGVLMVVESESGICGTLEMAPYSTTNDWQEAIFVGFEKGYIKIDLPAPLAYNLPGVVTVYKDTGENGPTICQPVLPRIAAMKNQAMNFVKVVRGEMKPPCEALEAAEDLKIATDYIKLRYGL